MLMFLTNCRNIQECMELSMDHTISRTIYKWLKRDVSSVTGLSGFAIGEP